MDSTTIPENAHSSCCTNIRASGLITVYPLWKLIVKEILEFTLAINRSEANNTKIRIFTKKIRSPITKIDERERIGFRMIFLRAYFRMRMGRRKKDTTEYMENWRKARGILTRKNKNVTISKILYAI